MKNIKVVSFDADGTVVKSSYVNSFWFQELPKLYADKKGVEFRKARETLKAQYDKIGDEDIRWYQPAYWFKKFDLQSDPREVIENIQVPENVNLYEDALETINELHGKHKLIITSNAPRVFLDYGLKNVKGNFDAVFSCVSDFGEVKKDESIYRRVTNQLEINGKEMVHVGDHWKFDYQVPRKIGINSFYIDRDGKKEPNRQAGILRDLRKMTTRIPGSRTPPQGKGFVEKHFDSGLDSKNEN